MTHGDVFIQAIQALEQVPATVIVKHFPVILNLLISIVRRIRDDCREKRLSLLSSASVDVEEQRADFEGGVPCDRFCCGQVKRCLLRQHDVITTYRPFFLRRVNSLNPMSAKIAHRAELIVSYAALSFVLLFMSDY